MDSRILCVHFLFFVGVGGILGVKKIPRGEGKGGDKKFQVLCVGEGRIFLSHSVCATRKGFFYWTRGRGRVRRNASFFIKNCFSYIK